ncbi:MAG: ABC transporter permease [Myxococcales bacterium]|nr:ABC transporter permease [Myxococcales bacterium]
MDGRLDPFKRIVGLARPELLPLAGATLALLGTAGLTLTYPQLVRLIVDGVGQGGGVNAVDQYAFQLLILFAVTSVLTAIRMYLFTIAGERIVTRLRQRLYASLIHQEIAFFDERRTGEMTNRLSADTTVVQNTATVNVSMFLRYTITTFGAIIILAWTSWRLTIVMLILVPIAVIGALFYGRRVRRLSRQVQDALATATEIADETLSGIRTVRAFSRETQETERYQDQISVSFELARKRARIDAIFGAIAAFAGYGAISGVLWYGGHLLVENALTMGELTSFLLYTFTVAFSIAALGRVWQDFMRAIGASERVFELLERSPRMTSGETVLPRLVGQVTLDDVDFSYPSRNDVQVLTGVSLTLKAGECVALVGPSGGGKSTIASLVSRFYDPDSGEVRVDGHSLPTLDANWYRSQIGVVAQDPILFATSIAENIRYGRPDATMDEVMDAARAANATEFVDGLPEGVMTHIGERGIRLSGGQRQRIAIARALLEDAPVLILDEATSALDAESEYLVQDALKKLMSGRTTLVIAHRLSTVKSADRILVINGGKVAQSGSHAQLMERHGLYAQLVERQLAH